MREPWEDKALRWLLRIIYCLVCAVIGAQVAMWEQRQGLENYCRDRLAVLAVQCEGGWKDENR